MLGLGAAIAVSAGFRTHCARPGHPRQQSPALAPPWPPTGSGVDTPLVPSVCAVLASGQKAAQLILESTPFMSFSGRKLLLQNALIGRM